MVEELVKNLLPMAIFQVNLIMWLYKNKNRFQAIHACDFDTAYTAYNCAKILKKKFVYDIF